MATSETPEHRGSLPDINSMWDYNKPAESETRFSGLLPEAKNSADSGYYLELLTQIARAQGLQGNFSDANKTLDEVEAELTEDRTVARIRYLLEKGRVLNSSGKPADSKSYFVQAWELSSTAGKDFYAVDAAHMIAIVEKTEGQILWNSRAIEVASASQDPRTRKWLASLYNNLGWTQFDCREYEKALQLFDKALAARQEQGDIREIRIAKWSVAKALRYLNRPAEALDIQQALLKEWEDAGEKDGVVFEEIGECLLVLGHKDDSRKFFLTAYEELSKDSWLVEQEPGRLQRLRDLANS